MRDVGGYPAADGRTVGWGRLYRSDSLGKLADDDWRQFQQLGVRTVIDLRYPEEIERNGRVPEHPDLTFYNFSVEHRSYDQTLIAESVEPGAFFADRYAEVAEDGVVELRRTLEVIAGEGELPLVFHCHAGKDRTGIVAALVLTLVGVGRDDVVADFGLTNLATPKFLADMVARGRPVPPWPGFARAPETAMRLFLAHLDERYGSVGGYVKSELGLTDDLVDAMKARLLD
jgi:protein-tyrosine phosphatase